MNALGRSDGRRPSVLGFRRLMTSLVLGCGWLFCVATPTMADTLVPLGATWRYIDTGVDQGTAWRQTNFIDSAWAQGVGQFGFGDSDEATVINSGPSNGRFPTYYFRNTFVVSNRASITNVAARLLRDDGVV